MATEPPAKLDYKSRRLVSQIVEHVKSQGIFDQFRRDCIDELEQKESYRQLKQRVESHVATFLSKQTWSDVLPKNQVRDSLRKHINQSEVLDRGVKQLISQALESKAKAFQTRIEGVVQNYIYTQKHPQNQDKQTRKRKTVDEKEETKPSTSEVISDISQLIPVPCTAGSKTESHGVDKGKSGLQEGSKSAATVKGVQSVKKSYSSQGKTAGLTGKGEEAKTGGPAREKDQGEGSSRTKDGKTRVSRVKVESFSRDDHSQMLPKSEENVQKVKDEKSKISRVKLESCNPNESYHSPLEADSGNSNFQDEKTSSLKGIRQTGLSPSQFSSTEETALSQGDVNRLSQVKIEKTDDDDSYVFSSSESKVKVKEERSETFGIKMEVESSEGKILQVQEKIASNAEKEHGKTMFDDAISKPDAGILRSDHFINTTMAGELGNRVAGECDVNVPVIVDEKIAQEFEGIYRMDSLKQAETGEKLEEKSGNKREEKRDVGTESGVRKKCAVTSDASKLGTFDFPATRSVDELLTGEKVGTIEMSSVINKSQGQSLSDERGLLSWQREDTVRAEPVSEKLDLETSPIEKGNIGHTFSTGEYSDGESDISEVSSVHTSDLSSFDDEISSSSESSYEQNEKANETEKSAAAKKNEDQEGSNAQPQNEQDSDAAPTRRSTRISSRRSTKEGESEVSGNEGGKIQTESPRKRRHGEKRVRRPRPKTGKELSEYGVEKRKRGRPRKEERDASSHSGSQRRRSRIHDQNGSRTEAGRRSSGSIEDRSKRSQRQIKRTRCYSPSSEGTREVFLPRKRSRDGPS